MIQTQNSDHPCHVANTSSTRPPGSECSRAWLCRQAITHRAKRVFDIVLASLLLWLSLPLLIMIAAIVTIDGGPVFFLHRRVGRGGRSFRCIKFRTMIPDAEPCLDEYLSYHPHVQSEWVSEQKLTFDPRVTPIGRLLRQSSADELPQLINVIRGEMSLVGPRPVTLSELEKYGSSAEVYKSVRPGMSGLWQVSGRNDVNYMTRVTLDERYVRDWSLGLDIWILFQTPRVLFSKLGTR
jgi:exopolysaccharide production protein ExoY